MDNGDLLLPNGGVATHREVQYIYRQRGQRMTDGQLVARGTSYAPRRGRAQLMLANAPAGVQLAIQKEEIKQRKKYIAVLRKRERYELKVADKGGDMQRKAKQWAWDVSGR